MKNLVFLASFLLGVTATSPVKQRQTTTEANVSSFSASTTTNISGASITFDLEIPGLTTTHCAYSDSTSDAKLPAVDFSSGICDDPAVKWQFRQDPSGPGSEGRYRIVIVVSGGQSGAGFHEWAPSDFPLAADETIYQGAPNFVIDISV
ncbi:hypothetical protein HD806DRAFT_536617 [Xylariaceae sp. AK1471]|nr:hypothetical protein HD806DRAFT_536617 [Xylariaceae sp. AK1471]